MATLEDKILGEKLEYYCSSSEDEHEESAESDTEDEKSPQNAEISACPSTFDEWDGSSSNTGPKGVIKDWRRFKQLEFEKRKEQEAEQLRLLKKLSLTCRSTLDDEKDKLKDSDDLEMLEDDFLLEYQKKRMQEMLAKASRFKFGNVINLSNDEEFLKAVDDEDKSVTVVVHIYEHNNSPSQAMNGCLVTLAEEYPFVKFCKILGSAVGLSSHFRSVGVPALIVYKNGQVVGNFVQITDTLGMDFFADDVERFLLEHGIILDKKCIPPIMKNSHDDSD